jgi:hypothetical protein
LNKVGKIVLPHIYQRSLDLSPDEVEIKGKSVVIINDDAGDKIHIYRFGFKVGYGATSDCGSEEIESGGFT